MPVVDRFAAIETVWRMPVDSLRDDASCRCNEKKDSADVGSVHGDAETLPLRHDVAFDSCQRCFARAAVIDVCTRTFRRSGAAMAKSVLHRAMIPCIHELVPITSSTQESDFIMLGNPIVVIASSTA